MRLSVERIARVTLTRARSACEPDGAAVAPAEPDGELELARDERQAPCAPAPRARRRRARRPRRSRRAARRCARAVGGLRGRVEPRSGAALHAKAAGGLLAARVRGAGDRQRAVDDRDEVEAVDLAVPGCSSSSARRRTPRPSLRCSCVRPSSIVQTSPSRRSVAPAPRTRHGPVAGAGRPALARDALPAASGPALTAARVARPPASRLRSRAICSSIEVRPIARGSPSTCSRSCVGAFVLARTRRARRALPLPRHAMRTALMRSPLRLAAARALAKCSSACSPRPPTRASDAEPHVDRPEEAGGRRHDVATREWFELCVSSSEPERRPSSAAVSDSAAIAPNHRLSRGSVAKSSAAERSNSSSRLGGPTGRRERCGSRARQTGMSERCRLGRVRSRLWRLDLSGPSRVRRAGMDRQRDRRVR